MRRLLTTFVFVFALAPLAAPADSPQGFAPLFNGTDLSGWKATGKADAWAVEDGVIVCKGGGGGYLLTEKEYGDFELTAEYRFAKPGTNSGIALRTPPQGDPAYQGMEIQLIDDEGWEAVHKFKLADYQHTGSIYDVRPAKKQANKPVGEWNRIHITCKGRQVKVVLNGEELVNANLDDHQTKFAKHPGLKRGAGHLGFQSYNTRVEFRNVAVKELR